MKKLYRCSVCGYLHEGDGAPDKCPKCGLGAEKFEEMSAEAAEKVYRSDRSNAIHMEIITLAEKIIALSQEGIEDNLDPKCLKAFTNTKNEAWIMKQRLKAEIAGHISLGKW